MKWLHTQAGGGGPLIFGRKSNDIRKTGYFSKSGVIMSCWLVFRARVDPDNYA